MTGRDLDMNPPRRMAHGRALEDSDQARAAGPGFRSGDPTRTSFPSGSVSLASRILHGQSSATDPAGMMLSTSST